MAMGKGIRWDTQVRWQVTATACLLEQVVEVAACQGLSMSSRVEITPWLSPIQLYRSQGENRMISTGLQRTTTLLFLFTTMDGGEGAWDMVMGKGKGRERNEKRHSW
jgi:hypothetical protein